MTSPAGLRPPLGTPVPRPPSPDLRSAPAGSNCNRSSCVLPTYGTRVGRDHPLGASAHDDGAPAGEPSALTDPEGSEWR